MALHNLYRPGRLDEVLGQEHVTRSLTNAAISHRLDDYQAMLFIGTRGCGKTTCARIVARLVNCLAPKDGQPCNECENCRTVDRCLDGRGGDVIELDAASNRSVEDIEKILDACQYQPVGKLRKKVFIIDEAHQLSSYAKDALLKTLEEPPAHVLFILATTEGQRIPQTVASRCMRYEFRNGDIDSLAACAKRALDGNGIDCEPQALIKAAQLACGSYREVLGIVERVGDSCEKVTIETIHSCLGIPDANVVVDAVRAVCSGDQLRCITITSDVVTSGQNVRAFIREVVNTMLKGAVIMIERGNKVAYGLTVEQLLDIGTYIMAKASAFETETPSLVPGLVLAGAAQLAADMRPAQKAAA